MSKFIVCVVTLVASAWASTLIGNPTVTLDDWNGSSVLYAWLPAPRFVFEPEVGAAVERTGPACDLAVGCSVVAPAGAWQSITLVVPKGIDITTANGNVETDGGTVQFKEEGSPTDTEGPDAVPLAAAWMDLN